MSLPLRPYDRQLLKVSVDATGAPYFRGDTGQGKLTVLILYGLYTEEGTEHYRVNGTIAGRAPRF